MEPLNSNEPQGSAHRDAALATLLQRVGERADATLRDAFGRLLADCDDVFFQLAERAASNNEQSMFFDALRAVRLHKDGIVARFHTQFNAGFQALLSAPKVEVAVADKHSDEALSLLQTDELEKTVALNSLIAKTRNAAGEQLYFLLQRLDHLSRQTTVDANNNPLDPAQLGAAFVAATEDVDMDSRARVVLFKQFERMLVKELPAVCADANQLLIDAGILQNISRTAATTQTSRRITPDAATAATVDLTQVAQLLGNLRSQAAGGDGQNLTMLFSAGGGQPIADSELTTLVADLQAQVGTSPSTHIDIRKLLKDMLDQRAAQGKPGRIDSPDEDIINLVTMFFDFVLEDRQLPAHAQALIGRLQFPVLKIALRDKTFFSNGEHPARRLINAIVSVGMGMTDSEAEAADTVYTRLATIVRAVNEHQEPSETVFIRALSELQEMRDAEENRAAKVEKRTCDSVQAEATTRQAKMIVSNLILERLEDVSVPEVVHEFLVNDWQQVLFLAQLKYGERSPERVEVEQTMDDLIWSSARHDDAKSQHRLQRLLPELQQRLRKWLAQTASTEERMQQSLQPLLALQARLLAPQSAAAVVRQKLADAQATALQPSAGQQKSWGDMTVLERQHVEYKDLSYNFIKQADDFAIGTWFSISKAEEESPLRCKLATKVSANDSYVFVNRLGFKVLEMKRKEFAYHLQQRRAKPLQTEYFCERTLNKVVEQLQQLAGTLTQSAQHSRS